MRLSGFWDVRRLARLAAITALLVAFLGAPGAVEAVHACERAAFEAVVTDAANALRDLNQKNKPPYQARLKDLRDKRGWTYDQFLKEAAPLVQDGKIAEYDERSSALLEKIQSMGAEGANTSQSTSQPQCGALAELQGVMQSLVDVQKEKWTYMFSKIEQEFTR